MATESHEGFTVLAALAPYAPINVEQQRLVNDLVQTLRPWENAKALTAGLARELPDGLNVGRVPPAMANDIGLPPDFAGCALVIQPKEQPTQLLDMQDMLEALREHMQHMRFIVILPDGSWYVRAYADEDEYRESLAAADDAEDITAEGWVLLGANAILVAAELAPTLLHVMPLIKTRVQQHLAEVTGELLAGIESLAINDDLPDEDIEKLVVTVAQAESFLRALVANLGLSYPETLIAAREALPDEPE